MRLTPDGSPSRLSRMNSRLYPKRRRSLARSRSRARSSVSGGRRERYRTIFRSAPTMLQARRSDRPITARRCANGVALTAGPTINGMVRPSPSLILMGRVRRQREKPMTNRNKPRDAGRFWRRFGQEHLPFCGLDATGAPIQRRHFDGTRYCNSSSERRRRLSAWRRARLAMAGAQAPGDGPHSSDRAGEVREALCEEQQERLDRRGSYRRGGIAADDALRRSEVTEQVDLQALQPGARSPCRPADPCHLPDAGFLPRVWIAMHQGAGRFKADLPRVLADEANDLTPAMRRLLTRLSEDVRALEARIAEVTGEIEDIAAADDTTRRLMTIPGIGLWPRRVLLAAAGRQHSSAKRGTWRHGSG